MIWDRVIDIFRAARPPTPLGVDFHDRRRQAAQSHHGYKVKRRSLASVTGICLHQTACNMGSRVERYDGTGAHVVVSGRKVIWLHDWTRRVAAANGWNAATVSIEVNGLFAGVEGDLETVWDDPSTRRRETPMTLDDETAEATLAAIRWIRLGVPNLRVIVAHRQASRNRRNDPGEAIWKRIAIPARDELGLATPRGFTLDDGRPIPEAWDPQARGVRY